MSDTWYLNIVKTVEEQKKNISERDQGFFHISRFLKAAKISEQLSDKCEQCRENMSIISIISKTLSDDINMPGKTRRGFERNLESILKHLTRGHRYYPKRYFISLYTFFGILIGCLSGFLIMTILAKDLIMIGLLIGFAGGVIGGRIIGNKKDKIIIRENKRF